MLPGILGIGLASVLLVAGISSAALSIGKGSSSRPRQEMEPLTEQQELFEISGEEVHCYKESMTDVMNIAQNESDINLESKEGAANDVSPSLESSLNIGKKSIASSPLKR